MARIFGGVSTDKIATALISNSTQRSYSIWVLRTGDGGGSNGAIWQKGTLLGSSSQTFNSTGTWQAPAGVTSVIAECWGGGAGGITGVSAAQSGGGGGGGAYAKDTISVTPLTTYNVTVGAAVATDTNGNLSNFVGDAAAKAEAAGGSKGTTSTGGVGGTTAASTGTTKFAGGNGGNGAAGKAGGGGGGESAGSAAGGNTGSNANVGAGGAGGTGVADGGDGGAGASATGGPGVSGVAPGGGGGGGQSNTGNFAGGGGAVGKVVLSWNDSSGNSMLNKSAGTYNFSKGWSSTSGEWSISRPSINVWHHIVVTYNGSSASNNPIIYVDGSAQSVTPVTTPVGTLNTTDASAYWIGNRESDSTKNWSGNLAEFGIWDRILTPDEVLSLSKYASPLFLPLGLVLYIPLIRDSIDLISSKIPTLTGTTITEHPKIIYPGSH